jgi:hypothetical protein
MYGYHTMTRSGIPGNIYTAESPGQAIVAAEKDGYEVLDCIVQGDGEPLIIIADM